MSETVTPPVAPGLRLPVAVLAVVATVVVSLLVVALVVRLDADRLPSGPPRDPPAQPESATRLEVTGRQVGLEEFSATLAGPPYTCTSDVSPLPAGLDQLAQCTALVHRDYDGKGNDWGAATGIALVDETLVAPGLSTTTDAVFDLFASALYTREDKARFTEQSDGAAQLPAPAGAAWTQQADVRVERPGLPTPYDRLVVVVVRLESGAHVAFFSDFPKDGSKQTLQAVVDSVGSLEAQR